MFIIKVLKKGLIFFRTSIKIIVLFAVAALLIIGATSIFYKQTYSVTLNGQFLGYTENKSELQTRINEYINNGNGGNIAFVQVDYMPEYQLCLLKKGIVPNDEEIYQTVISQGTVYYKYYALTDDGEEKVYVENYEDAESIVNQLKEKNSKNKEELGIIEKYGTEEIEYASVEKSVEELYEEVVVPKTTTQTASSSVKKTIQPASSPVKTSLGISLIKPVSGTITSRFGSRWGRGHQGIDIGAPKGTSIRAAAGGTVTIAKYGYNGGYGNYVKINHGNGIETIYGHCSALNTSVGKKVSQGQVIAYVGSTGRSTGNHLHFEIRVNGTARNPQNYVY